MTSCGECFPLWPAEAFAPQYFEELHTSIYNQVVTMKWC
jgi:hypothetical protein